VGSVRHKRLDAAGASHFVIEWAGTLEDLCAGDAEWERELREHLREYSIGEPSQQPIADDEARAFVQDISEYGF